MSINWNVSKADMKLIQRIADRAVAQAMNHDIEIDLVDVAMDIAATHANGCRLDLSRLLGADEFNFAHDVVGIRKHLNRETGTLGGGFLPRFSLKGATANAH